jgi:ABC-type polysaccharide/polyol phosphate export permease
MPIQSRPEITIIQLIAPLVAALIFITLCSLFIAVISLLKYEFRGCQFLGQRNSNG